jgi:DNA-binding NarL/FixJ family response regulator
LAKTIRAVLGGQYWACPQVLAALVEHARILERAPALGGNSLTAREGQILRLLVPGLTNKEISKLLVISERTVKFHVSHSLAKFGIEARRRLMS